jgi:hypothetical protein
VRRWIREGRLEAETAQGRRLIDPGALDEVRDEMYPMLPLPSEWQTLEDGTPAPNWVAAVALSRLLVPLNNSMGGAPGFHASVTLPPSWRS